jgi:hypothetical protein
VSLERLRKSDVVLDDPVDIVVAHTTRQGIRSHPDKTPSGRAIVEGVEPPSEDINRLAPSPASERLRCDRLDTLPFARQCLFDLGATFRCRFKRA